MGRIFGVAALVIALVSPPAPAAAEPEFDWGNHSACAVMAFDDVRCFATEAEMEESTSGKESAESSGSLALLSYCNGSSALWLYLYEHTSYGGRVLKFRDVDYWQNLSTWGFDNQTSSYKNDTQCAVYLAENSGGGGSSITVFASSQASSMPSGWNDRVSSLYIDG